jgi:hypothetical protein
VLLLWFVRPDKIATFLNYTRPLSAEQPWFSLRHVLFYVRSLAMHHGPGPLFVLITLASLIWAAVHWRDPRLRLLFLYFVVGMGAIMLVNHPPNPRFIATFVPAAHLLTGAMVARLFPRWPHARQRQTHLNLATAGLAILLATLLSLPVVAGRYAAYPSALEAFLETSPENSRMAAWIDQHLPDDAAVLLINYWDQFSPQTLAWHLTSQQPDTQIVVDGLLLEPASPQAIANLRQRLESGRPTHLVLFEGGPWGAPFWPDYTAALAGRLAPVADADFTLRWYDAAGWLDHNIIDPDTWEQVKSESFHQMDIGVIIYKLS